MSNHNLPTQSSKENSSQSKNGSREVSSELSGGSLRLQTQLLTPQRKNKQTEDRQVHSQDVTRYFSTGTHQPEKGKPPRLSVYTGCNCSKSKCLKMYCACFAIGRLCDHTCLCEGCQNDHDNMQRSQAINEIIVKDPHAFSRRLNDASQQGEGCNCRRSGCAKKYCDCFQKGRLCSEECKCEGCRNGARQQQPEEMKHSLASKRVKQ